MTHDQFEIFNQPDKMSIVDYINEYKRLDNKIPQLT